MTAPIYLSQAFRLFFPLAGLYTAVSVMIWLCGLSGFMPLPPHPTLWHAHAMLLGFAVAVIAGFTLTAAATWTGQDTTTPRSLAVLVSLWLIARVLALLPTATGQLMSAAFDSLVLPCLAVLMSKALIQSGNHRNYVFIPLLSGLALINVSFHVALQQEHIELARTLITLTAWLVGFLMVFMGGRVIPFFSGRRCGYTSVQLPWLNWFCNIAAIAAAGLLSFWPLSIGAGLVALLAGLSILLRVLLWQPWRIWREPMLWILHLGYVWLAVAYVIAGIVHLQWLEAPTTLPLHALMAGGLGCLSLGMMTRVALGHSGRPIVATPLMQFALVLVVLAGALRVGSYIVWPLGGLIGLTYSAIFWFLAFLIYFLVFAPLLWRQKAPQP